MDFIGNLASALGSGYCAKLLREVREKHDEGKKGQ